MILQRGARTKIGQYSRENQPMMLHVRVDGPATYDYTCFGLDQSGKLADDAYMVFYNQPTSPCGGIRWISGRNGADFVLDLSRLPAAIDKLAFTVSIDGVGTMEDVSVCEAVLKQGDVSLVESSMSGKDFRSETAVICLEIYRKPDWRVHAVMLGFNGGLGKLLQHYGGEEVSDQSSAPVPVAASNAHKSSHGIMENIYKYIHPQETIITERLMSNLVSTAYCEQLLENYRNFDLEKDLPDNIGKCLEVNNVQLPNLYKVIVDLCRIIDIKIPEIYVYVSPYFSLSAEGLDNPWIQISAKSLENFSDEELRFVIARELVHIKLDHIKYEVLCEEFAKNIETASRFITIPGFAAIGQQAIDVYKERFRLIAANWTRVSEYTADRCALAACDYDIKSAVSAILKQILNSNELAKHVDLPSFLKQTEAIMSFNTIAAKYTRMDEVVPYGPFRIKELISFASVNCR